MHPKLKNCLLAVTTALLVICLGALACGSLGEDTKTASKAPSSTTAGSGEVASVNGAVINRAQFDNALGYQQEIATLRGVSITDEQLTEIKYQVLENLINQELLYQESQRYGISIDDTEIDEAYDENKQKADFKTDDEFEAALKKSNKSVASYREEIKKGLAIDRFIQNKFTDHAVVSDSDTEKYYDSNPALFMQPAQVRASHIMARVPSDADSSQKEEARTKIEKVMERLKAGEDFASIAGEVSEDASSKDNGGDLGYLSKGQAPQSFEAAAFALKKGEISGIVETGSGYHIINVTDRKDAGTVSYDEAKNGIMNLLKTNMVNSGVEGYIKALRIKSTIVTYPITQ